MTYPFKPGTKVKLSEFAHQFREGPVLEWVGLVVRSSKNWTWVKWPGYQEVVKEDGRLGLEFRTWMEPTDYLEKTLQALSPSLPLDKAIELSSLASSATFDPPKAILGKKKYWKGGSQISRLHDLPAAKPVKERPFPVPSGPSNPA